MKLETRHYVELELEDKETLLANALGIDDKISRVEFIDYIEELLNLAIDLRPK